MRFVLILALTLLTNTISAMRKPTTLYIKSHQVVYIGESEVRNRLEKIYGTKFSLETVFFHIGFKNAPKVELPQFIPYDYIKDCTEFSDLTVKLHGSNHTVICQQQNSDYAPESTFLRTRECLAHRFLQYPNWLTDGAESLVKAGVIRLK